jgi:hypothetical protein
MQTSLDEMQNILHCARSNAKSFAFDLCGCADSSVLTLVCVRRLEINAAVEVEVRQSLTSRELSSSRLLSRSRPAFSRARRLSRSRLVFSRSMQLSR